MWIEEKQKFLNEYYQILYLERKHLNEIVWNVVDIGNVNCCGKSSVNQEHCHLYLVPIQNFNHFGSLVILSPRMLYQAIFVDVGATHRIV